MSLAKSDSLFLQPHLKKLTFSPLELFLTKLIMTFVRYNLIKTME